MRVVLYTRQGCHLCEEALELLRRYRLAPEIVDVDADPALRSQFDHCVPVVAFDGKVRFRGRVNEVLLKRLLAPGRASSPPRIGSCGDPA